MKAIRIYEHGGPEILLITDVVTPEPRAKEVLVRNEAYAVREGDTVLIHAAAGGVGLLLVQMIKKRGATVIGTVSSAEKAQVAREAGADHLIISTQMDFATETMRLTDGRSVHVVYDSVGRTTFENSLNVLRVRGSMVVFGLLSGPVPPFDMNRLSGITGSGNNGSLFLTFATLNDNASRRQDLLQLARDVLNWIAEGSLSVRLASTFPLTQAASAHRLLESRKVVGKLVLLP